MPSSGGCWICCADLPYFITDLRILWGKASGKDFPIASLVTPPRSLKGAKSPPEIKKGGLPFRGHPPFANKASRSNRGHANRGTRTRGTCPRFRSVPAAAAASAAAAEAASATTAAARAGPSFVSRQGTALEVDAVQSGDGLLGLFLVRHLDEAETAQYCPCPGCGPSYSGSPVARGP